jgi:hypothetical protein
MIMSTARIAKTLLAGLFCTALISLGYAARRPASGVASAPRALAQKKDEPDKAGKPEEPKKLFKYSGAGTCILCHTEGPVGRDYDDKFVLLTEYATWRTQDKHSFAYLALLGPRGRRMGELLGIEPAKDDSCLNCHAMNFPKERQGGQFHIADGVSCDGCHGPSSDWIGPHIEKSWRLKTAVDKEQLGMRNLRDPAVRAGVCASCHVGNTAEGKVVTHAMYAAGHPPLPNFELATFSRNLPQHWRDRRDVPFLTDPPAEIAGTKIDKDQVHKLYHMASADSQQAQLVTAGSLVCLRSSLNLVAERSNLEANEKSRTRTWPELTLKAWADMKLPELWPQLMMAQADCYACHHELQRPSWRQVRGYSGPPGRPQVQSWPVALAKLGIGLDGDEARGQLGKQLDALHAACNARPFGDPAQLSKASQEFAQWSGDRMGPFGLADATPDRGRLLRQLCSVPANAYPDYDSARQIASAVHALYTEWQPKGANDAEIRKTLDELAQEFNLRRTTGRTARLELMKRQYEQILEKKLLTDPAAIKGVESISNRSLAQVFPVKEPDKEKRAIGDQVRQFLSSIRTAGDDRLTELMLKDPKSNAFLDALHEINEKELTEAMDKVPGYDPVAFKKRLATLGGLLPKE